jgi:hypothetical protein
MTARLAASSRREAGRIGKTRGSKRSRSSATRGAAIASAGFAFMTRYLHRKGGHSLLYC